MTRALLCLLLAACGGVDPGAAGDDDVSAAPSPFVLQFTGRYDGSSTLVLMRDGTFLLDGERGRFRSPPSRRSLPITLSLGKRKAVIAAYDGRLRLGTETLRLARPTTSDEELCDATAGQWTDDDADPATGLYCVCPAGAHFIPSSGGCVR